MVRHNEFGQPIGEPSDFRGAPAPQPIILEGQTCRLVPVSGIPDLDGVAARLLTALGEGDDAQYTYLPFGPFPGAAGPAELAAVLRDQAALHDWLPFVIETGDGPVGIAAYLRIAPAAGSLEVGSILYAPRLRRTRAATEAMYLLARHAFALGYRRYEWKCDALNEPSRRAAERLGFLYEGTFRQALVYKGRNRDTAWFAMTDGDWRERVGPALEAWLEPANHDAQGAQGHSLSALRRVAPNVQDRGLPFSVCRTGTGKAGWATWTRAPSRRASLVVRSWPVSEPPL
jgi:RimJ/RimL family protein N-acetyltransferase